MGRKRMRLRWLTVTLLLGCLLSAALATSAAPGTPTAAVNAADAPHGLAGIQPPALSATAALAVDLTTGVELYEQNADTPAPPASTMKIVTALVARQTLQLDDQITVQDSDLIDPAIYSTMGLEAGDVVSVGDLLRGLLIPSGGDAGNALARAAGQRLGASDADGVARFVTELNTFAANAGLRDSRFTNPIGADDPNELSTARDLARATQLLLGDQFLTQTVETASQVVHVGGANPRDLELHNSNQLLGARDDVFGIKTGTEDTAGQCLILGYWRGDDQIISVVLGSQDRYADAQALMDAIDAAYRWEALGLGASSAGASDALAAQGLTFAVRRTVLMTQAQAAALTYQLDLNATSGDSTQRGVVIFRVGDRVVGRLPVYSTLPR
jgi:D-alanyl-D-alanine carboxypeptidase (penicillin-binding protein 5/6)